MTAQEGLPPPGRRRHPPPGQAEGLHLLPIAPESEHSPTTHADGDLDNHRGYRVTGDEREGTARASWVSMAEGLETRGRLGRLEAPKDATQAPQTAAADGRHHDGVPEAGPHRGAAGAARTGKGFGEPESGAPRGDEVGAPPSWYYAKPSTPNEAVGRDGRRSIRYLLRQVLHSQSALKRVRSCGTTLGGVAAVIDQEDVAHYGNLETCGSIHACPVCSAKIRTKRAADISLGLTRHVQEGGGAYFVTITLPHGAMDPLAQTLGLVNTGLGEIMKGGAWRRQKDRIGYVGHIRALEVTHGMHGWHPHLHVVVLTERPLTEEQAENELNEKWRARWDAFLWSEGWEGTVPEGVQVVTVTVEKAGELGEYIAKVQEKGLGSEMARADLKSGRRGSRVPFRILADAATDGLLDDFRLYREYERATRGKAAIRWSRGLRARLLPDVVEKTDEELAAEEVGGQVVAFIDDSLMRALNRIPGAPARVLSLCEAAGGARGGGFDAIVRYVQGLGLDPYGVHEPGDLPDQETG